MPDTVAEGLRAPRRTLPTAAAPTAGDRPTPSSTGPRGLVGIVRAAVGDLDTDAEVDRLVAPVATLSSTRTGT